MVDEGRLLASHLSWQAVPPAEGADFDPGVRVAVPASGGARDLAVGFSFGAGALGLSAPLRFGLVHEAGTNQGGRPSGAFGAAVSSNLVFVTLDRELRFGESGIALDASLALAGGRADYAEGAMLQASGGLYTAGAVGFVHRGEGETRLTFSQPLRAESGTAELTYPYGRRASDGERLYATSRLDLAPEAREVRLTLRHDHELGHGGRLAVEAGERFDAGHVPGQRERFVGVGYEVSW